MKTKLLFAALLSAVSSFNPGGTLSVEYDTLSEAKTTYFDYVLNGINQVKIPDIKFDIGSISQNQFKILEESQDVTVVPG